MKQKLFTLLTLLLCVCSGAWAETETIFSAAPTAAWSVAESTSDAEITSSYATISGGKMYLTNKQTSAKDMIKSQGGEFAFQHTNNDTFFKVVLNKALAAGDVITVRMQSRTDTDLGLWLSTETSRPGTAPTSSIDLTKASSQAWVEAPSYTVKAGDGIVGQTTFYIYRATGKSTYFNTFKITREITDARTETSLSFTAASGSKDINDGTSYTLPSLNANPNVTAITGNITYTSNNTAVATVNSTTGAVTLLKKGTAKITASFAGDETYKPSSAEFTLTVEDREAFDPSDYNVVKTYDFTGMPNTTLAISTTAEGKIWNAAQSTTTNNNVYRCTNSGLESIAIQAVLQNNRGWSVVNGSGKGLYEGSGAGRCAAVCDIKAGWIVEFYHTSGENFFTRNNQEGDEEKDAGIKKTVLLAEAGHHVFQAESDGMLGFELTKGTYVNKIIVYTSESPITLSFGKGDAEGNAPASITAYEGATYKLPINQSLSKSNYTLTGWNDGSTTYNPGQTITGPDADKTFNPVFTENTQSLTNSESATTVIWNFRNSEISLNMEGTTAYYVKQAKVNSETIDIPMYLNTTSGKLNNQNRNDQWIQVNEGTTLTIPAVKGMLISFGNTRHAFSSTTIAGTTEYSKSGDSEYNYTASYTYNGEASTIDIIIGNDISYMTTITVNYPVAIAVPSAPVDNGTIISLATGTIGNNVWTMTSNTDYKLSANSLTQKSGTSDFKIPVGTYTISVPEDVAVSTVAITGSSTSNDGTTVTIGGEAKSFTNAVSKQTFTIASPNNGADIVFTTSNKEMAITSIALYVGGETITLTTSNNMDGWRAFYPEGKGYTLDENTTAYVITANPVNNKVSLEKTSNNGKNVYPNTPVILYTSSENHKMTLTKANVAAYEGANLLSWATKKVSDVYRLGYNASDGVGFYPYSGTPASGAVILNVSSAPQGAQGAKALMISFGDETALDNVSAEEKVSKGNGKRYNLAGQLVGEGYKGIVIENGKKFNQ